MNHPNTITPAESRVLALLCDGLSTKAVAEKLCLSVHTVDTHRSRIYKKATGGQAWGLNPIGLFRWAVENGYVACPCGGAK